MPYQQPITRELIEAHLEKMQRSASELVSVNDLIGSRPVSCVDGRKKECIAGVPGGNAGLFLVLLGVLERYTGEHLDFDAVERLFLAYLDYFGHFYVHTDQDALRRLGSALGGNAAPVGTDAVGGNAALGRIEELVRRPPAEMREWLLDLLVMPDHVGCGHLNLMLVHSSEYGLRLELVKNVLRAFFRGLWRGDERLIFDLLAGVHREEAVVVLYAEPDPSDQRRLPVPLHCPSYDELDVFLHHPQVSAFLQEEQAFFAERRGIIEPGDLRGFIAAQQHMAAQQLRLTLGRLAPDLPVYQATITPDGVRVTGPDGPPEQP
jgi:hypothetical protein